MKDLSIVVLTYNELGFIKDCLKSIFESSPHINFDFEVIVIDNGSKDGTSDYIKKVYPQARLVVNRENKGVAAGRNQGIELSSGQFILFLDSDATITSEALNQLMNSMMSDQNIYLMGPFLISPDGSSQPSPRRFPTIPAVLIRGLGLEKFWRNNRWTKNYLMPNSKKDEVYDVDWVLGACQIIRMRAFEKVGKLDERFFFGYEDIDFCKRLHLAGLRVCFNPQVSVNHFYQRISSRKIISKRKWQHIKSIIRYFKKYGIATN